MTDLLRSASANRALICLTFCFSLSPFHCYSSNRPLDTLDQLVLDELASHRIVMLGDGFHGHGAYQRLVTGVLEHWLEQLQDHPQHSQIPRKLVLVRETVDSEIEAFNHYLARGDLGPWLDTIYDGSCRWGGWAGLTTDELEFCYDLRKIWTEVQQLKIRKGFQDVDLAFVAGEGVRPYSLSDRKGETQEAAEKRRFLWFAFERDSLIAHKIDSFLSSHKEHKALVFYGTAHLVRGLVDKNRTSGLEGISSEPLYAYFLAHYLDSLYGRANVSVITSQNNTADRRCVEHLSFDAQGPDYRICQTVVPPEACPVDFIRSRRVLDILLRQLNRCSKSAGKVDLRLARATARRFLIQTGRSHLAFEPQTSRLLDSLRRMATCLNTQSDIGRFVSIGKALSGQFDAMRNIEELERWIDLWGCPDSTLYVDELRRVLRNVTPLRQEALSLQDKFHVGLLSARLREEEDLVLREKGRELRLYLALNLLWVGTPEEQKTALTSLQGATGLSLSTAGEWSRWWRERFFARYTGALN